MGCCAKRNKVKFHQCDLSGPLTVSWRCTTAIKILGEVFAQDASSVGRSLARRTGNEAATLGARGAKIKLRSNNGVAPVYFKQPQLLISIHVVLVAGTMWIFF